LDKAKSKNFPNNKKGKQEFSVQEEISTQDSFNPMPTFDSFLLKRCKYKE